MSESKQEWTAEREAEWQAVTTKWLEDMHPYYRNFIQGQLFRIKLKEAGEHRNAGLAPTFVRAG